MPYRPTEVTRARDAAARARILQAALDQLAEGGYASASVAGIARRAELATGSVYRHFSGKGELFAEAFRAAAQREIDVLKQVRGDTLAERLAACVETFIRRALAEPIRAYALLAEPVDATIERERLHFRRAYADLFAQMLKGLPLDAHLAATAIVGALGEALVGPLARRSVSHPGGPEPSSPFDLAWPPDGSPPASPRDPTALVTGLQAFVINAVGAHDEP